MNFIRRLNRGNVNLSRQDFTYCNLLGLGWKLATNAKIQLNISKIITVRLKRNTRTWDLCSSAP